MNLLLQYYTLIALLSLLGEIVEIGEAYRVGRPYKHYQHKPWHRPRWHAYRRSPKSYGPKRIPPRYYNSWKPGYYSPRYRAENEDFVDQPMDERPYTIVIELPKRDEKRKGHYYQRNYDREREYSRESDYIEDDENVEARMYRVDRKKVHIKVTKGESPKLQIQISRADSDNNIEIVDKSNLTDMDVPLRSKVSGNLTFLMEPTQGTSVQLDPFSSYANNP